MALRNVEFFLFDIFNFQIKNLIKSFANEMDKVSSIRLIHRVGMRNISYIPIHLMYDLPYGKDQ